MEMRDSQIAERLNETPPSKDRVAWVTGVGIVSSLGVGAAAHWEALSAAPVRRRVNTSDFAPYPVFPLTDIRLDDQIPNKADHRQMGRWQQIGVYAAGLALADAGLKGAPELLAMTDVSVAAGNGERDAGADANILKAVTAAPENAGALNAALQASLRPTLYLGELSNLLAGNISIVHGVTRSSRTFKGEEQAGVAAFRDAVERIRHGTSQSVLVGGACNAERWDALLSMEVGGCLWSGDPATVRQRGDAGGGIIPGSVGAFLVVEEAEHARSRGIRPYARVGSVAAERLDLPALPARPGEAAACANPLLRQLAQSPFDILSGASGAQPALKRELSWLAALDRAGLSRNVRHYGDVVGHGLEAHFLTGIALASISLSRGQFIPPFDEADEPANSSGSQRILVTGFGHWRGAGAALMAPIEVAA